MQKIWKRLIYLSSSWDIDVGYRGRKWYVQWKKKLWKLRIEDFWFILCYVNGSDWTKGDDSWIHTKYIELIQQSKGLLPFLFCFVIFAHRFVQYAQNEVMSWSFRFCQQISIKCHQFKVVFYMPISFFSSLSSLCIIFFSNWTVDVWLPGTGNRF